jgi:hypothetical protein
MGCPSYGQLIGPHTITVHEWFRHGTLVSALHMISSMVRRSVYLRVASCSAILIVAVESQ